MTILDTRRLRIRPVDLDDAAFLCRLFNQDAWLANIGDRGVHTDEEAREYIETKTFAHVREHGLGMNVAERRDDGSPVGLCGLVQRDFLPSPDLGYALLEEHFGQGYAREMTAAVVDDAFDRLGVPRLLAIVLPGNMPSRRVLEALDFQLEDKAFTKPEGETLYLYAREAPDG